MRELAGNLCEQAASGTGISPLVFFPGSGAEGRWSLGDFELNSGRRARGRAGRRSRGEPEEEKRGAGQQERDMRRYGAGPSGSTTTTTTTEDSPESLREVGTPAEGSSIPLMILLLAVHILHSADFLSLFLLFSTHCCSTL